MPSTMYDDVVLALADAGIRFVVTGGVAVALHGFDRPVPDLDIVVDPEPANLNAVMACLSRLGFWPSLPLPIATVVVLRTMDANGREVDVNRIYPIPYATLIQRAEHVPIDGRDIAITGRNDLVAIKQQRGRDYDLNDIRLLEE